MGTHTRPSLRPLTVAHRAPDNAMHLAQVTENKGKVQPPAHLAHRGDHLTCIQSHQCSLLPEVPEPAARATCSPGPLR